MSTSLLLHAGCVALRDPTGGWAGVLLRGPSGAGKSDLALRLLEAGWRLVADDRARVWASGGALYARAPGAVAGLIEVRGVDIVLSPPLPLARVALVVDAAEEPPERLPEPAPERLCGVAVPRLALALRESSAPAKLRRAVQTLGSGGAGA